MTRIWDESPYTHTMLLLHIAMGDAANDEGEFWYRQETLAKKARVSTRYLYEVTKTMIEDGYLETYKRGRRKAYRLLIPELSSGTKPEPSSGRKRNSVPVPIEPSVEPSGKNHQTPTGSGSAEGDDVVRSVRDDDQEMPEYGDATKRAKKPKGEAPPPGTSARLVWKFREECRRLRVYRFNISHLNRLTDSLREEEELSNEEIEILIGVFFARYGETVRSKREFDPVRLFHQQINSGLVRQADDLIEKHRRGGTKSDPAPNKYAEMWRKQYG